jgi:hypothetical protein
MLITTNVVEITSTEPMITGSPDYSTLHTISFLIHSSQKYIQQTAPASMKANHPEIAVTTGFKEFLSMLSNDLKFR